MEYQTLNKHRPQIDMRFFSLSFLVKPAAYYDVYRVYYNGTSRMLIIAPKGVIINALIEYTRTTSLKPMT
ncbi:hypothetical protein ROZALSC1DRAFT_30142 [Rozella allomycis CSF55]|uniref:Uncharacterized protein n=1 Tax=Rozella allomycis (strain CSF55) TaxID=988480 RepID=A0A075AYM6_ROZAC|nr:hypothetical protein O9G_004703 [Rozella allomycis CSF55]RKP18131.1 hypothetical protein ROZALSC1DRAFT_30142 [Rozella allomycis CSF55]|eukprot:EPZ35224.1 hypothetical protein O9G_004703 [Rozella allomycis CSF55]